MAHPPRLPGRDVAVRDVLLRLLLDLSGHVARLDRRTWESRPVAARDLLLVARKLVVVLRRVSALSFASRDDESSRSLHAACSRAVSINGGESDNPGIVGRRRKTRGKSDCASRGSRLFDHHLTGWTVRPSTRVEKRRPSYGTSEWRSDRAGHDPLVSIHSA